MSIIDNVKSVEFLPLTVVLASIISAVILRFNLQILNIVAFVLIAYVFLCGVKEGWLLLLGIILFLFALEPTPLFVGRNEVIFISLIGVFIINAYVCAIHSKQTHAIKIVVLGSVFFLILASLFYMHALNNHINLSDWSRGIGPFLLLYMMFPIFLSLHDNFEFKVKWLFISFCILTLMFVFYINIIYFLEHFNSYYWIDKSNNSKIFHLTSGMDKSNFYGPFRERITLRIQQSTSEILPLGFSAFTLLALLTQSKKLYVFALAAAIVSLFTILETLTRSMLMAPLLVFLLWFIFYFKNKFLFLKVFTILFLAGMTFTYATNMDGIWLGRFKTFAAGLSKLDSHPTQNIDLSESQESNQSSREDLIQSSLMSPRLGQMDRKNPDQNLIARLKEYQIAWSMFLDNPVLGAGFGVKHDIDFQTSDGRFIHETVAYVHNWAFYWLMAGGMIGFLIYSSVLFFPILFLSRLPNQKKIKTILIFSIILMCLYANFFAVFRLISFNLFLAFFSGITLLFWSKRNSLLSNNEARV